MTEHTRKMLPSAVIFDMDGVMVNSEPNHYQADTEVFASLGIQVTEEERKLFLGISASDMYDYLRERYHLKRSQQELLELDICIRKQHLLPPHTHLAASPGLVDFLKRLQAQNLPMAVASSSVAALVQPLVHNLELGSFFVCLATGDQVRYAKPFPDIFLLAAGKLGVPPETCVAIEDSPNGLKAAHAAGMKSIGYSPLRQHKLEMADRVVSHFDEITPDMLSGIFKD